MQTESIFSRRQMLKATSCGFGYMAFAGLSAQQAAAAAVNPMAAKTGHFPARAKRVIFLCMSGGPSHLDTFDYKPMLKAGGAPSGGLLASPFQFSQHGQSGLWLSELF